MDSNTSSLSSDRSPILNSDKNCAKGCGLEYGISQEFDRIVHEQQQFKLSKSHIQPFKFVDLKNPSKEKEPKIDVREFDDVMFKTFGDPEDQQIFQTSLAGMKSNYPEIWHGTEKNMFYQPASFNLHERVKGGKVKKTGIEKNETCDPDALEELSASLQAKANLTKNEKDNLDKMRRHLRKLWPKIAERQFVDSLACFFYNHRGMFIHSLELNDHLKVLKDKAKLYRKRNNIVGYALTDFELKLMEQLSISEDTLNTAADTVMDHFLKNSEIGSKIVDGKQVDGDDIRSSLKKFQEDTKLQKGAISPAGMTTKEAHFIFDLFKPQKLYSEKDIRERIIYAKFQSECQYEGESDIFIVIPDEKVILCIEIKRNMNKSQDSSDISINMKKGSAQLQKMAQFISTQHGAILSPDWRFAKVLAVSPKLYNSDKICSNCRKFILTPEIVNSPKRMTTWWQETGLADRSPSFDPASKDEGYRQFQLLFNRIVCMLSVKIVLDACRTWEQVQGRGAQLQMSAGRTETPQDIKTKAAIDDLDFDEDILKAPHHAYKILFLNKDQMALLTSDAYPCLIFMNDFGAGNQLLSIRNQKYLFLRHFQLLRCNDI